jgi:hypothetical protein
MIFRTLHLLLCKDNACYSAAVSAGNSYVQVQKMATVKSVLKYTVAPTFPKNVSSKPQLRLLCITVLSI